MRLTGDRFGIMEIDAEDHGGIIVVDDATSNTPQRKRSRHRKRGGNAEESQQQSSVIVIDESPGTSRSEVDENLARRLQLEEQEKFAFALQETEYREAHEKRKKEEEARRERQMELQRTRQEELDALYAQSLMDDPYGMSHGGRYMGGGIGHPRQLRSGVPYGHIPNHTAYSDPYSHQQYGYQHSYQQRHNHYQNVQPEVGDDYESLLALDDTIVKQGLSPGELDICSLQQVVKTGDVDKLGTCVICLGEFEEGETIRRLQCLCVFHKECVDHHFKESKTCPICRKEALQN